MSPEHTLNADYLNAARRRRPRVDPTLLDWKKLTGDENVAVINRTTGKKVLISLHYFNNFSSSVLGLRRLYADKKQQMLQVTGSKAPSLKRLAQWLMENPTYDVDPKWAELVKERGNLPHELQKRLPAVDRKNKGPGRPQLLGSPPEAVSSSSATASQANLVTSMASSLSFPSLATAGLGGLPTSGLTPGLLSGLSLGSFDPKNNPFLDPKSNPLLDPKNNPLFDTKNLSLLDPKTNPLFDPKNLSLLDPKNPLFDPKNPIFDPKNSSLFDPKSNPFFDPKNNPLLDSKNNPLFDTKNNPLFDPKNNPLLLPFGGLPNMGALGGMGPLGNSMSFFANLASLGLPSLSGLDPNASASNTALPTDQASPGSSSSKNKSRKSGESDRHNTSKTPPVSSASTSVPSSVAGGLPFYFPNPSLLYSPMGLGGLNPFSLPPGALSSAYDSLAQQCGLLNGSLGASTSGTPSSRNNGGHRSQTAVTSSKSSMSTSSSPSSSHRHHRTGRDSMDRHNLQHLLLPHDAHLLESLGRVSSMEAALRGSEKRTKEADRKDPSERPEKRPRESENSGKSSSIMDFSLASARTDDRQPKRSSSSSSNNKPEHDKKDSLSTQSLLMSSLSEGDDRLLRHLRDTDMKEALEALSRTSAEFLAKSMSESAGKHGDGRDISSLNMADLISRSLEGQSSKRPKEAAMKEALALSGTSMTEVKAGSEEHEKKFSSSLFSDVPESVARAPETTDLTKKKPRDKSNSSSKSIETGKEETKKPEAVTSEKTSPTGEEDDGNVDIEDLLPPATVSKTSGVVVEATNRMSSESAEKSDEAPDSEPHAESSSEPAESTRAARSRRGRSMKKTKTKTEPDEQPVVERKNLRSSAGRAARAAAERAALKEFGRLNSEKSEDEDEQKSTENRDES